MIAPITYADANVTAYNVAEDDYVGWSAVTAYLIGDRIIVTTPSIHKIYECLIDHTNEYPPTSTNDYISVPYWLEIGATNAWKMLGLSTTDQTIGSADTDIDITITPAQITTSVAFFNTSNIDSITITMTDPTVGVVYSRTIEMITRVINGWYDFFFRGFTGRSDVVFIDLPSYKAAYTQIVITPTTGNAVKVGALVTGKLEMMPEATTLMGTGIGIQSYTRKEIDAFGNYTVVKRKNAKRVDYQISVPTLNIDQIQRMLAGIDGEVMVWIGDENKEGTIVLGWYKDFSLVYEATSFSNMSLDVEGLV